MVAKCFLRTLSLHESAEVAAPVSGFWLKLIHAIKVEIGHGVVFGIPGHINDLRRKTKKEGRIFQKKKHFSHKPKF